MTEPLLSNAELTAKQRLAVSRQDLVTASEMPVLGTLALWCLQKLAQKPLTLKAQSDPAANGRIPS